MKVGIDLSEFTSIHQGGKDEVAYNLLRGLCELGYANSVVCFCTKDLVEIVKRISNDFEICIIPDTKLKNKYADVLIGWLPKIFQGMYIKSKLKIYPIDVLLFTNKMSPWISFGIPTVLIPHDIQVFLQGTIPGLNKNRTCLIRKNYLKMDFLCRSHIIAISDYDKAQMIKFMPWSVHKIKRIYNPIRFSEPPLLNVEKQYITALNIQWLHKNIKTLIKAYGQIALNTPYDLILVGKKPNNYNELATLNVEYGIEERVHFTGYVTENQLNDIIARTRIYVNPSFFEGFGMTAVEMMGRGIPTIVADTTANPETTQGLCKYYAPADDANALAETIMSELTDPTENDVLKNTANYMREKYSYVNIASQYWTFFEEIGSGDTF